MINPTVADLYEAVGGGGVTHRCPPEGGPMPCCGRTPFEVPTWDRMTLDPALVTCTATSAKRQREDEMTETRQFEEMMAMLPDGGVLHNLRRADEMRETDPAYEAVYEAARAEADKRGL